MLAQIFTTLDTCRCNESDSPIPASNPSINIGTIKSTVSFRTQDKDCTEYTSAETDVNTSCRTILGLHTHCPNKIHENQITQSIEENNSENRFWNVFMKEYNLSENSSNQATRADGSVTPLDGVANLFIDQHTKNIDIEKTLNPHIKENSEKEHNFSFILSESEERDRKGEFISFLTWLESEIQPVREVFDHKVFDLFSIPREYISETDTPLGIKEFEIKEQITKINKMHTLSLKLKKPALTYLNILKDCFKHTLFEYKLNVFSELDFDEVTDTLDFLAWRIRKLLSKKIGEGLGKMTLSRGVKVKTIEVFTKELSTYTENQPNLLSVIINRIIEKLDTGQIFF
ncbi:hypothetical protein CDIK_1812 [Cucumispora dikerogammari]|nr:hypothetical protein CDIK_1812 [Cucumispora dikerogammari]